MPCYFDILRNIVEGRLLSAHSAVMKLQDVAPCLEALGNETRLGIYRRLVRAGEDGLPVGAVQRLAGVPRSTLSHHLHRLIRARLVSQERRGTTLVCRADYSTMNGIVDFLTAECCADTRLRKAG